MKVRCLYRVHTKAPIFDGVFDTDKGLILDCPELVTVDATSYQYYETMYREHSYDDYKTLYTVMLDTPNALAVIGYNCMGTIIVTHTGSQVYYAESHEVEPWCPLVKEYDLKLQLVGVAKTKVKIFNRVTPQALLFAKKEGNKYYVYTQQGCLPMSVKPEVIEGKAVDMTMHLEMCKAPNAWGTCTIDGVTRLLTIENGKVKLMRR